MNALSAAAAAAIAPPAPPAVSPRGEPPADRPFDEHLADASQARARSGSGTAGTDRSTNADAAADDTTPGTEDVDAEAQPGLPGLSPWASYLPAPVAPQAAAVGTADSGRGNATAVPAPVVLAAGADTPPLAADIPADAKTALTGPVAGVTARPAAASMRADPGDPGRRLSAAAAQAAVPSPAPPEAVGRSDAIDPSAVLQDSATVPVNTAGPHPAAPSSWRSETPAVPGPPVPLHAGALQDRIDTALRWMATGGLQAAQLRVDPEALGPITVHLRLDGDVANVMFGSNHEQTRQALESSLAGLKDVLAAGGLHLGQASVGSEQQSGFLAARQFAGSEPSPKRETGGDASASAAATGAAALPPASAARSRAGNGMVDLYA